MSERTVTICVVNYKTLDLTRLCLRSIRRYTRPPFEMMVVDNNSADASVDYLRSLPWIRLIERKDPANDSSGGYAHAAALDLALSQCGTEFFISLHSDTVIRRDDWLEDLLAYFREDPMMACVGGGKVEWESAWRVWLKKMMDYKTLWRKLGYAPDPLGMHRCYNRTVCCAYRTAVLKKENLAFLMDRDKGLTVGKKLYFELVDRGYRTVSLPDPVMRRYLYHLAHATQVINEREFAIRKRTRNKTRRIMETLMQSQQIREIIQNQSLDQ